MPTNPTVGLSALTMVAPAIPSGALTLSVDSTVLALTISADLNTVAIDILIDTQTLTLINPTVVNGKNQFTGTASISVQSTGQVFQLTGMNWNPNNAEDPNNPVNEGSHPLITPTLQYQLLFMETGLAVTIQPPSGVTIFKGQNSCVVQWSVPPFSGLQGVRVQWSTDPTGITTPYTQFGDLVLAVSSSANYPVGTPTTSIATTSGTAPGGQSINTIATTTTSVTMPVNFSSVTIPFSTVNADEFYVILTTVIQDPTTNAVYESIAAGPFTCGFVNLKLVSPTDFLALQKSSDIASRLIASVTRSEPQLDLTAMSEIRDVVINNLALELANMSVREWFSRCAQSIFALAQIDDPQGTGTSIPVANSTTKQQIARAYGLSQTDVQTFIGSRFDIIGNSQAGLPRGGSTTSVVMLTFYVYAKPTQTISIPVNCLVSTTPDSTTAAVQFETTASGVIDPSNSSAYFDPANGWWSVTVPAQCTQPGSVGEVGAETVNQVISGGPSGVSVINLNGASGGTDQQSNSAYAAMIADKLVAGVDTGSRKGYTVSTLGIPGVTDCLVVAAGDTDMLRDWSTTIQNHTFGCVDIYTRGTSISEQDSNLPFQYQSTSTYGSYSTYIGATLINNIMALASAPSLIFKIANFSSLPFPLYATVEFIASSVGRTIWLGVQHAQFDNTNGYIFLDPTELAYQINSDGSTSPTQINGANATNLQVIQAIAGQTSVAFAFMARYESGINYVPTLQPVLNVDSVTGPVTGLISPNNVELVYTEDFLLTGGSNAANDTVAVASGQTIATSKTVTLQSTAVTIDSNMSVALNANGQPQNVLSVRSTDTSTLYTFGIDYNIVATGPYRTYGIAVLAGGALSAATQVIVAYNKFVLNETITFQTDSLALSGTTETPLLHPGLIENSWLPASYGNTTLLLDGWNAQEAEETGLVGAGVIPANRYIKVAYNNGESTVIGIIGQDFTLTLDGSGNATIARVSGGQLPDGAVVTVNYFTNEVFTIATQYPTYVQQAINVIDGMKHAAADVLVKAMVASDVDITMVINLTSAVTPDAVDGQIRTVITNTLNNADTSMAQSVLSANVQGVQGVASIQFPLVKCAKSDGSYSIGEVITTGTVWNRLTSDTNFQSLTLPANSWITANPALQNPTIPSGGKPNAYVGLLYEGQGYTRANSIQQFLTTPAPAFYIIGSGDQISSALPLNSTYEGKILVSLPSGIANPGLLAFRVTYQVFGASTASDISVSSTEYLAPGHINILYSSGT